MKNNFFLFTNVIIIFFLIFFIIYVYKTRFIEYSENLKIINFVGSEKYTFLEMSSYIDSKFKNIFLINGRVLSEEETPSLENIPTNKLITIPYISPNVVNTQTQEPFLINQYNCLINKSKDFVFLTNTDKNVVWNTEKIKRNLNKDFLVDQKDLNNGNHNTHLIFSNYLYKNNNAVHVNYIVKKKSLNKTSLNSFIQFLNFFSNYLINNKILFFSIAGNANIVSNDIKNVVRKIFKDSCYLSPGIENKFITEIDQKIGARCSQFIIVSKTLAPNGVYFYLTRQRIEFFSNSNILVCEILSSKDNKKKSSNDDTENIYENFLKEKIHNTALKMDFERDEEFNVKNLDFKQTGIYNSYEKQGTKLVSK